MVRFFLVFFLFLGKDGSSQDILNNTSDYVDSIKASFSKIITNTLSAKKKKTLYKDIFRFLTKNLSDNNSNLDKLDSITGLKQLRIKDKLIIYSWFYRNTFGYVYHYSLIANKTNQHNIETVFLIDTNFSLDTTGIENRILYPKNWLGAFYYDIKELDDTTYLLLGWRGANNLLNQKVIEILNMKANEKIINFGKGIFANERFKRKLFRYSNQNVMTLKFDKNKKSIRFDYLVPSNPRLKGIYEYYGPSVNRIDEYKIERDELVYIQDVDAKNQKTQADKRKYNNPK